MNLAALGICFCLSIGAGQSPRDAWFAEDKVKHFVTSFVVTSISASAARAAGMQPAESAWAGAAVGGAVGIWKELRDSRAPGQTASFKDLVWDAAGVAAAVATMREVR